MTFQTESRIGRTVGSTGTRTRGATVTRVGRTRVGTAATAAFWVRIASRRTAVAVRRAVAAVRETVSTAGLVLVAAGILGLVFGLVFGWIEALVAAGIALALLALCAPFLAGSHDYGAGLVLDRERVVAGNDFGGRLELVNRGRRTSLPGVVDIPIGDGLVEVQLPMLRPGAAHVEELAISAARRGVIDIGPMTIGRGDPLGILRREQSWPEVRRVHVHPVTTPLPSTSAGLVRDLEGTPTTKLVDADLSFHAVRHYAPGDSRRHVHWKSTAKTGTLMVRQYEESRHARIGVVLDLDAQEFASDDEFELSVSAAASLGLQGVREGRDVLVASSGELPEFARGEVQSIRTFPTHAPRALLDGMSEVVFGGRVMRIEQVARLTAQTFGDLSIAFLVTGSRMPLGRLRQSAIAFPQDIAAVAVRAEPGAEPTVRRTRELTVITIGALHDLAQLLARGAVR